MKTYYVYYGYTFTYIDDEDNIGIESIEYSKRFHCLKKDIKKEVTKYIEEVELKDVEYSNLKVMIIDFYETTDYEV